MRVPLSLVNLLGHITGEDTNARKQGCTTPHKDLSRPGAYGRCAAKIHAISDARNMNMHKAATL